MDLKNPRQNSANFSHNNDCADVSTKNVNKKKFLKVLGAGTLAIMMGIGTLFGVVLAPMNSAQANASANATTESAQKVVENPDGTIQVGMSQEETTAALMNGTWECEPEIDPVVYTTDYGLDIKWHLTGYTVKPETIGKLSSGFFSGYAYISAGGYNWAIIGRGSKITASLNGSVTVSAALSSLSTYTNYTAGTIWYYLSGGIDKTTPSGSAIYAENSKQIAYTNSNPVDYVNPGSIFPNAKVPSNGELGTDEVLCFAQTYLSGTSTQFTSNFRNPNYSGSVLQTAVNTWYNNNLKSSLDSYIVTKSLNTTTSTRTITAKLFPLGGYNDYDDFRWQTYMTEGTYGIMDVNQVWWLRTATDGYTWIGYINKDGKMSGGTGESSEYYIRPAFVLKV